MSEKNNAAVCTAEKSADVCGFTPGPWSTDGRGDIAPDDELIITGAVTRYGPGYPNHTRLAAVALVERSCNEAEDYANARLIAAAPELYAALARVCDELSCYQQRHGHTVSSLAAYQAARAALAKVHTP